MDVVAHPLEQHGARDGGALVVFKHPPGRLRVPHQRVPHDEHPVPLAELDVAVGGLESITIRPGTGMDPLPLHHVFGRDGVEVPPHQRNALRVAFENMPFMQSDADQEIVLKGLF
jgi:hypothetical protein